MLLDSIRLSFVQEQNEYCPEQSLKFASVELWDLLHVLYDVFLEQKQVLWGTCPGGFLSALKLLL